MSLFFSAYGQLNLNTGLTPAQLVQNSLTGGGVTVSNITYTGGSASKGTFTNGSTTNLGLNNGVVLATCPASLILNNVNYLISNNMGLAGDADLDAINNGCQTYDACILEFDFVPMSDTVKFRYVFGSEEYPNYVCSQYNDVFAFFVSGPNPAGGNYNDFNIARIPGTNLPVSVNSVNSGIPGNSYNSNGCISLAYSNHYVNNIAAGGTNIAFNGFTKPLTAWCKVIPCQTYHIKIAVADGYNGLYDSAVFLEANSFTSSSYQITTSYTGTSTASAIEGCTQGVFSFKLSAPATAPYTINFSLAGTAVNGTDYSLIPTSVTIPAGSDSAAVTINPISDGVTEGNETVSITYTNGCVTETKTIVIADYTPMQLTVSNDTALCEGVQATLNAHVTGGSLPLTYSWNNGNGSAQIAIAPTASTAYSVTVTDNCANTLTASINVTVNSLLVSASATDELCSQSNGSVVATVSSDCNGSESYVWSTSPSSGTPQINNLAAGTYTVTVSCGACVKTASATVNNHQTFGVDITETGLAHCGQPDGFASVMPNGGTPPYTFLWNAAPPQNSANLLNVSSGVYTVTITDAGGCSGTSSVTIGEYPRPDAAFTADPAITIPGNAVTFYNFSSGANSYFWSFGDSETSTDMTPVHYYQTPGIFDVFLYAYDDFNCADSIGGKVVVNEEVAFYIPNAFSPDGDGFNDFFGPKGAGLDNDGFEMYIYDRWGKLHFMSQDIHSLWDGTSLSTGNLCPPGVYTWIILMKKFEWDDELYRHTGVLTLLM